MNLLQYMTITIYLGHIVSIYILCLLNCHLFMLPQAAISCARHYRAWMCFTFINLITNRLVKGPFRWRGLSHPSPIIACRFHRLFGFNRTDRNLRKHLKLVVSLVMNHKGIEIPMICMQRTTNLRCQKCTGFFIKLSDLISCALLRRWIFIR